MPDWEKVVHERFASLGIDPASNTDIIEELVQHLDDKYRELCASSLAEDECQRRLEAELDDEALRSYTSLKRRGIVARPLGYPPGKTRSVAGLLLNLRMAFRSLRTRPAFSMMVIGILGLGIGGNAAIFSVFNSLYLRPLPFPDSSRLVDLDETAPRWNLPYVGISAFDLLAWRKNNSSFDGLAFFRKASYNLASGDATGHADGAQVTYDMLEVLRLAPELGRNLSKEDDQPGAANVALLGHNLWLRMFHGDRRVLGQVVKLDDEPYTIVGVLPPEAVFPDRADIWTPLAPDPARSSGYYANGIGRLKNGVSVAHAQADLLHLHKAMISEGRTVNEITSPVIAPIRDRYLGGLKNATELLMVGVAVVLLIACVDIAALLLVRDALRSHEIAVRMALGASRSRIAAQLLTENLVLAFIGGILGISFGEASLRIALSHAAPALPQWIRFSLDWRFAIFCLLVTSITAFVFGIVPTLQCTRINIRARLGDGSARATSPRGQSATLGIFVVSQVAFALTLSISAGLLLQAFRRVMAVDPGFNPENAVLFHISVPDRAFNQAEQKIQYYESLLGRLEAVPGVKAAAATSAPPLGAHWGGVFVADRGPDNPALMDNPTVLQIAVTPGYVSAAGMTLLGGRSFTEQDTRPGSPMVAMVNETFARHFWGTESPIGKRIRRPSSKDSGALFNTWFTVIGLLRDERHDGLDQKATPSVFLPLARVLLAADSNDGRALRQISFVVRTSSSPTSIIGTIRDIASELNPTLPIYGVETLEDRLDSSLWARRTYSWLFQGFAIVAILLAMAGVYGIMSYTVSQRVQEFGIRMALGAQRLQLLRHVLARGLTLVVCGIAVGLLNALWVTSLLRSLLFGVGAHDLFIYGAAAVVIAGLGLIASLQPGFRAASVSPLRALRGA